MQAQTYPVNVQVSILQPVPPYLPQIKADIAGQRYGQLNQDISNHLSITLTSTGATQQHLKLAGSIERIAPAPMGVSLRPDYQPSQPILLNPRQMISLNRQLLQETFGNFNENALLYNNLSLQTLQQNGVDYKLPEGTYRACVTAYDYDKPGFSAPLSPPGSGCAYFTICYTAAAPQLIQPVSTMLQSNSGFQDLTPHSPQIAFTWTPPTTTCGLPLGALTYNLEIRQVFPGQTISDAQNNPFVFRQQNIPATTFLLDTLKYPHVLVAGQQYIVRVKANFTPMPGSPLEIANQGYSQIGAFAYQPASKLPVNMIAAKKLPVNNNIQPAAGGQVTLPPGGFQTESATVSAGACPNISDITNTTFITTDITGQDITISGFTLHVDQAVKNTDGSFKGNGYITWSPFGKDIRLKATFDTIRVNTDKVVYAGKVHTSTDGSHPQWAPFNTADPVAQLTGLDNSAYEAIKTRISDGAHLINELLGNEEVDFPLGLNTTLGGTPVTLAIMGIIFQPSCTNMSVLLDVNLPDMGGWLSLAGIGFQTAPDKVLQQDKSGILYLPQHHDVSAGGMKFSFDPCTLAGDNSIDTAKGTYVQWNGSSGLEKIVVNADLQFTDQNTLVSVDKNDNRLSDPFSLHASFTFSNWNDWMAAVAPDNNFEIGALPGFMIAFTGGYYDHSVKQNPDGITFPSKYSGSIDAGWEGLYVNDLSMQLPSELIGNNKTSFGFHHFILDNTGITTTIGADHVLDINTGNLGGWAFSIDSISIGIVQNNFQQGMKMTGGIKIPLSDSALSYTCNLSVGDGSGINYQFAVSPKGNYDVSMWAATISLQNSSLTIDNNKGQFNINANLNGNVSINTSKLSSGLPDVSITALSFQGMKLTNHDPKSGGFSFDPGNWSMGGKTLPDIAANTIPDELLPQTPMLAGGPQAPASIGYTGRDIAVGGSGGSQGSADGFGINFTGFRPYVDFLTAGDGNPEADIGITFTLNAVLDESGLGIGGSATMDVFGKVELPKGGTPKINPAPNFNLDSVGINFNMQNLMSIQGGLKFFRNNGQFGNGAKGDLDLTILGTVNVDAAAIFGNTGTSGQSGYTYWGLAALAYWQQGIMFPPGLSLNGLGGGFHYNMGLGNIDNTKVTSASDVSSPDAIINELQPKQGTLGFDAQAVLAFLGPNVVCLQPTFKMDFSSSHGLEDMQFSGNAEILSSNPPQEGSGLINATAIATYTPNPQNFNCTIGITSNLPVISVNVPVQFNVGDGGNYLYIGTPAPQGTDFSDPNINSMVVVQAGFDAAIVKANMAAYAYFDIGTQLPAAPYIPPAITNSQAHDGSSMAQGVINKFSDMLSALTNTNDNSHNVHGTVNNPGFMLGAGIHFDAGLDLVVVNASGSLDIGFAALLEHFDPSEVPPSCAVDGKIGFNNWYALAMFYANLNAELGVGPFTVGSVDAGAVLTAGLVSPTWAAGDIYIDASALGVIHFHDNTSISIGSSCSINKDPLDNIDMIGDFGPRDQNGQPVDVYSVPYVVGNVPLNQDYIAMVNNGDMRTYQFRIDQFDVSKDDGTLLPYAKKADKGEYEVDLYHDQMLCGNAAYNAHIVCRAYQQIDGIYQDPVGSNGQSEQVVQDTTFSFTTGPRPQTIEPKNLIYSYPIDGQRYLLKNEFGGKGRLEVVNDVGYLLNNGGTDDCGNSTGSDHNSAPAGNPSGNTLVNITSKNTPSVQRSAIKAINASNAAGNHPSVNVTNKSAISVQAAGALSAISTHYLAKFLPTGGGDTLQSAFTYTYDHNAEEGTLEFPLPAGLQNGKSYTLQIWVVPPKTSGSQATVAAADKSKVLTQTTTQYVRDDSGHLVATQVTRQVTNTTTNRQLNGERQMVDTDTARCIFSLLFGASRYNTFADKMAAYGNTWSSDDEASYNFNIPVYSTAANTEPFDEFEIKGYTSACAAGKYADPSNKLTFPPLFNADIPWDGSLHNDEDAGLLYVSASALAMAAHATLDWGAPEIRGWFGVPSSNLVSLENMPYQPKLTKAGLMPFAAQTAQVNTTLSAMKLNNNSQAGSVNSGTSSYAYINNTAYEFPAVKATANGTSDKGNHSTPYYTSAIRSNGISQAAASYIAPEPPPGLLWKRDDYFYNDYMLIKDFAQDLSTKYDALKAVARALSWICGSCTIEQVQGYYGSVTLSAAQWDDAITYNPDFVLQDINAMLAMQFIPFPPTAGRKLHFTYNYACNSCVAPAQASAVFNYKSFGLIAPSAKAQSTVIPKGISSMSSGNNTTTPIDSTRFNQIVNQQYHINLIKRK